MRPPLFSVSEGRDLDGTMRIVLSGELDLATAPSLERLLTGLSDSDVLIDLADLDYLDSSGLAVFVAAHFRAAQSGGTLRLSSLQPSIERVLAITGLLGVLQFQD